MGGGGAPGGGGLPTGLGVAPPLPAPPPVPGGVAAAPAAALVVVGGRAVEARGQRRSQQLVPRVGASCEMTTEGCVCFALDSRLLWYRAMHAGAEAHSITLSLYQHPTPHTRNCGVKHARTCRHLPAGQRARGGVKGEAPAAAARPHAFNTQGAVGAAHGQALQPRQRRHLLRSLPRCRQASGGEVWQQACQRQLARLHLVTGGGPGQVAQQLHAGKAGRGGEGGELAAAAHKGRCQLQRAPEQTQQGRGAGSRSEPTQPEENQGQPST